VVKDTNYEAPCYAIIYSFPLPPPS